MTVVDLEPRTKPDPVSFERAEELAARVMAAAADVAQHESVFLELVGEFDAQDCAAWWTGLQGTAQWLAWACSIAPGTAREHVRVARALRRLPAVRAAFAVGELTFSKVREVTRVADQLLREKAEQAVPGADQTRDGMPPGSESLPDLDEEALVELAKACTAAQLARTVSGWRAIKGNSRQRRARQRVSWVTQEDGCVHLTAVLPAEEGQAVIAAIQAATDANTDPEPQPGDEIPDDRGTAKHREARLHRSRVEGLVEIANHYLAARPEDRSGEDRTMVVIEINAAALEDADTLPPRSRGNAAGTVPEPDSEDPDASDGVTVPTCRVRGGAALEPSDARRTLCDSTLLGVIVDHLGMPLAVGREERLVTKHQRRALMIRDQWCQFPGCSRTRHLQAHHRISWLAGGRTDLDNLILLCKFHHVRVHDEQVSISACPEPDCQVRWLFVRPDGTSIAPIVAGMDAPSPWRHGSHDPLAAAERDRRVAEYDAAQQALADQAAALRTAYDHVHNTKHPRASRVFPVGGGEGFLLVNCIDALFGFTEPHPGKPAHAA